MSVPGCVRLLAAVLAVLLTAPVGAAPGGSPAGGDAQVVGITEPLHDVTLRAGAKRGPSWSGRVARVLVKEGDAVQAGQALVELDRSEEELEATLRKVVFESKAELQSMLHKERTLKHLLDLSRQLHLATKSVSREELERKELEVQLVTAERQRLEANEEKERIELAIASDQLAKRTVRTPIPGTVVRVHLQEGESCEANEPLVRVADTSRCVLVVNVDERIARTMKAGQSVQIKVQAGAEMVPVSGTVSFVSPVADPASGLLRMKVEFPNADGQFRPGVPGALVLQAPTR